MTKNDNKFGCDLYIYTEEENPIVVTVITKIKATEIIIKGSQLRSHYTKKLIEGKVYDYNLWLLKLEPIKDVSEWHLEEGINKLLDILEPMKENFVTIFKQFPESFFLCYLYSDDFHFSYNLSKETLNRLNYYGLRVEFDLYSLRE